MEILVQTAGVLDALLVDLLLEIAMPVEQSDRDKIQVEVAGRLAMVAGENAEAAGIIWDRFVKAKLSREISDRFSDGPAGSGLAVGILAGQIISVGLMNFLELAEKIF